MLAETDFPIVDLMELSSSLKAAVEDYNKKQAIADAAQAESDRLAGIATSAYQVAEDKRRDMSAGLAALMPSPRVRSNG